METKKTSIRERIRGIFIFTKNCLIIYFQGLKEATGKNACYWNINATYFKGGFAEQKRNDFSKNIELLTRHYENNVRYDFNLKNPTSTESNKATN